MRKHNETNWRQKRSPTESLSLSNTYSTNMRRHPTGWAHFELPKRFALFSPNFFLSVRKLEENRQLPKEADDEKDSYLRHEGAQHDATWTGKAEEKQNERRLPAMQQAIA